MDVPAVSVSILEDVSIQSIHKQLGVEPIKPLQGDSFLFLILPVRLKAE